MPQLCTATSTSENTGQVGRWDDGPEEGDPPPSGNPVEITGNLNLANHFSRSKGKKQRRSTQIKRKTTTNLWFSWHFFIFEQYDSSLRISSWLLAVIIALWEWYYGHWFRFLQYHLQKWFDESLLLYDFPILFPQVRFICVGWWFGYLGSP